MKFRENWGSTLSLVGGLLSFAGAINNPSGNMGGLIAGPVMIIGALIYRSAKKRRANAASVKFRIFAEAIGLLAIAFIVFGQNDFKQQIALDPVPNFVIPLWALIAYAYAFYRAASIDRRKPEASGEL
ncbi:hypothetical protein MCEMIH15_01905 [Caulobacteraceae bacterium]